MKKDKKLENTLKEIRHPAIDASLEELGMLKVVKKKGRKLHLKVLFPFPGVPIREMILEEISSALKSEGYELEKDIMGEKEREKFLKMETERWKKA